MIQQTQFPFNMEITNDKLTSKAGLSIFAEYCRQAGLTGLPDKYLASPKSNRGFKPSVFVNSLVLLLTAGGRCLDDLRELKNEKELLGITGIKIIPEPDTVGNWLRRTDIKGLNLIDSSVIKKIIEKEDINEYTLDIDATEIIAEKRECMYTYKNNKGYMPMLGFLFENGICLHNEFREGNISPAFNHVDFYKKCKNNMPHGKIIKYFRADSASYQSSLINTLEEDNVLWSITADIDSSVKKTIKLIKEWVKPQGLDFEISETVHCTNKTNKAFRLIIKREYRKEPDLFEGQYFYHAIAANLEGNPLEVLNRHNKRGQAENFNKEIKCGFSMESMPCGTFSANEVYFAIGILSYNLFIGFKSLNPLFSNNTIKTFRWFFLNIAGKIIKHSGKIILKIKTDMDRFNTLLQLRQKILCMH